MSLNEAPVTITVTERRGFLWGLGIVVQSIASLVLRLALAFPFFRSGLTRWADPLVLADATKAHYAADYVLRPCEIVPCIKMGLPVETFPLPYPEILSYAGSFAEIILPAALVIGFATRLSALGLLAMIVVIVLVNPAGWATEQLPWGAMALALLAYGPGRISFDSAIWRGFRKG